MYKLPNLFKLYITKSDGLKIEHENAVVFLKSEDNQKVGNYLNALNIPSFYVRYIGYSRRYKVLYKNAQVDVKGFVDSVRDSKVIPYKVEQLIRQKKSFYYDITQFTNIITNKFHGINGYNKTIIFLNNIANNVAYKRKKYLILIKDSTISSPSDSYTLIYSILYAIRKKIALPFDKIFLFYTNGTSGEYRLIYDSSQKNSYSRLKSMISKYYNIDTSKIDSNISDEEKENEKITRTTPDEKSIIPPDTTKSASVDVVQKIVKNIQKDTKLDDPASVNMLKTSLDMLKTVNPDMFKTVNLNNKEEIKDLAQIAIASVALGTDPNNLIKMKMSQKVDMNTILNDLMDLIQNVKDRPIVAKTESKDVINDSKVVSGVIGNINLDITLSRRSIEKKAIENWLYEVASVLSKKDIPLQIKGVEIEDLEAEKDEKEVAPTAYEKWKIKYKTVTGASDTVEIIVPKLIEDRYTLLGGIKGYFPFVLAPLPIFVKQPGEVLMYTTYTTFKVFQKEKKGLPCTWVILGGVKFPLIYALAILKPVPNILDDYDVKYSISNESNKDCRYEYQVRKGEFLCVNDELKKDVEALLNGFKHMSPTIEDLNYSIKDEMYGSEFITKHMGNRPLFQINSVLDNVIDPITKKILQSRNLPFVIYDVLRYMNNLSAYELDIDKLDLENVRLRQQDVLLEAIYKVLNASYSQYRYQVLSNVRRPKLDVNPNAVIQFMRENNALNTLEEQSPVEELESLAKAKLIGPGALPSKEALTIKDRGLRESYFGTFDPIDTSEGDPGAYQTLTVSALNSSLLGTMIKYPLNPKMKKILSPAASLIPFVEKDDGNRALMACSQMKQSLALVKSEPPIVQTGYESILPSLVSSAHVIKAKNDGKVLEIGQDYMVVEYKDKQREYIDLTPHELFGMVSLKTASIKAPTVKEGQSFKKDEIIAGNSFIDKQTRQLAQGRNVNVAFMLYDGYDFEDGVVITESLSRRLTSLHYDTITVHLRGTRQLNSILSIGDKVRKGDIVAAASTKAGEDSIDYLAQFDGQVVDIDVYANSPIGKHAVLVDRVREIDNKILDRNRIRKKYGIKPEPTLSEKIKKNFGNFTYKNELIDGIYILIKIVYFKPAELGDKIHNRHGNKGVISNIIPDSDAPLLPNGEPIELMFTTLGVIGRMNMGQVFELYTGRIIHELENKIKERKDDSKYLIDLISKIYEILDTSENKVYSKNIKETISKNINKITSNILNGKHLSLLVPQFGNLTFKELKQAYKLLNINFAEYLYLPKYKQKTKNPVSVGVQFIEKLEHMAGIKETSRSLGRYNPITEQAVSGRKAGGGQRIGEMDTWAYLAYEADAVLSDFFVASGDKTDTKQDILNVIINNGEVHLPTEYNIEVGAKRAIDVYLAGLGVKAPNIVFSPA